MPPRGDLEATGYDAHEQHEGALLGGIYRLHDVLSRTVAFHFPDVERSDDEKRPGESAWTFLVRSSWPQSAAARDELERWLNEYPPDDLPRLLSRLSTGDDATSRSAHAELVMHALLRRVGGTVMVEPATPTGGLTDFRLPSAELDFEVYRMTTRRDAAAAEQRVADIIAGLRREASRDFWVSVNVEAPGPQPPSLRPIRAQIRDWLSSLDWQAARDALDSGEYLAPTLLWEDPSGGWRIEVQAWPRATTMRGAGPAIGIQELDPFLPGIDALRGRLFDKLDQHRGLDRPLVLIADLSAATFIHDDEIEDAVYGTTVLDTTQSPSRQYRRRRDCVWPDPPPNRPAGILALQRLHWGTARSMRLTWMLRPDQQACPLPGPWEVAALGDDGLVHRSPAVTDVADVLAEPPVAA